MRVMFKDVGASTGNALVWFRIISRSVCMHTINFVPMECDIVNCVMQKGHERILLH